MKSGSNQFRQNRFSRNARLFQAGTFMTGLGDGVILVIAQLYLISLGFDSSELGAIFMLKFTGTALISIPAGFLADRYGKTKILISSFILFSFSALILLFYRGLELLGLSFLLFGLSDAGTVVLNPLYSSFFESGEMDKAFGLLGFLNIIAISIGSLFGFIPPTLVQNFGFTREASYWLLILIAMIFYFTRMSLYVLSSIKIPQEKRPSQKLGLRTKTLITKFSLFAMLREAGYAAFFSLFPFYANTRFGVDSDGLGSLFFLSWIFSALSNVIAARVSNSFGALKTTIFSLALSAFLYFMISLAPNFIWVSLIFLLRVSLANLSSPLVSSLFMRLLPPEEKSTGNSFNLMAVMVGSAIGTWFGGRLMREVSLNSPIYIGSVLYFLCTVSFYFLIGGRGEKIDK
ncbi:MFS transporter [Candidatus Bathyarchaeota archaeon]|nr:MFS transporter [Candidatus Bathyarchaeota archaeon]